MKEALSTLSTLTIVFVVLKLCAVIDWSWWLVLLPSLIEVGIVIVVLIIEIVDGIVGQVKYNKMINNIKKKQKAL